MSALVVVTLNLLHGAPLPGARAARGSLATRLDWVAGKLAAVRPDIVLLQEASTGAAHENTAAILARRLEMKSVYAPANPAGLWRLGGFVKKLLPGLEFEEGPAILSRLPILERRVHRLSPRLGLVERRIALEVVLGGPRGPFSVFSVHLTAFSQAGRRRQIAALMHAVESSPHHHSSIVGGDFNAEEHAPEIRLLTEVKGWIDSFRTVHPEAAGHTWGHSLTEATATAGKRIDFLFSVPAGHERWQVRHSELILASAFPATRDGVLWASDHFGVRADFAIPQASPADRSSQGAARSMAAVARATGARIPKLLAWQLPEPHRGRAEELLRATTARQPADDWQRLPEIVRSRHGDRIRAIVGYGSWYAAGLRKPISFPDLYLIVDDYRLLHESSLRATMNRLLPPDVSFLWNETPAGRVVSGKLNFIDTSDVGRECGPGMRDLYNAGRLSKLVWVAWAESDVLRAWLVERLADASQVVTAIAAGLLPEHFSLQTFSLELLAASYRAEARLEGWERIRALRAAHAGFYDELHLLLLDGFAAATGLLEREGATYRKLAHPAWGELAADARRLLRRSRRRGYLRWARIVFTEPHLLELAANEAERKAGVRIRVTPRLARHPLLFGLPEFRRVLRERNTREPIRRPRPPET